MTNIEETLNKLVRQNVAIIDALRDLGAYVSSNILDVLDSPRSAYEHATKVLFGPFPEGETIIATDARYAYDYAMYLGERFLIGEASIATDANLSYWYAYNILSGPFSLGEEAIARDSEYAWKYARDILKKPFPLGEWAIATSDYRDLYQKHFNIKIEKQNC